MLNPNYSKEVGLSEEEARDAAARAFARGEEVLRAQQVAVKLPHYTPPTHFNSWDDAVRALFVKLDKDRSGSIDGREMRALAARLEGVAVRHGYREALRAAGKVMETVQEGALLSYEDFEVHCQALMKEMQEEDVALFVSKVIDQEETGVIEDRKAALIDNTCVPVLREALMDMFRGVERFHMDTAAGTNLEDGYLPRNFKHFNPLKHLGKWLNARSKTRLASGLGNSIRGSQTSLQTLKLNLQSSQTDLGAEGSRAGADPEPQLGVLFEAISNNGTRKGLATQDTAMRLVKLGFPATPESQLAEEKHITLDQNGKLVPDTTLDFSTFCRIVRFVQARVDPGQAELGVTQMVSHMEHVMQETIDREARIAAAAESRRAEEGAGGEGDAAGGGAPAS